MADVAFEPFICDGPRLQAIGCIRGRGLGGRRRPHALRRDAEDRREQYRERWTGELAVAGHINPDAAAAGHTWGTVVRDSDGPGRIPHRVVLRDVGGRELDDSARRRWIRDVVERAGDRTSQGTRIRGVLCLSAADEDDTVIQHERAKPISISMEIATCARMAPRSPFAVRRFMMLLIVNSTYRLRASW